MASVIALTVLAGNPVGFVCAVKDGGRSNFSQFSLSFRNKKDNVVKFFTVKK